MVRETAPGVDEVLVCIAAAADSGTKDNPFTSGERREMISLALEGAGIGNFSIIDIPDIHNPPVWARYVASLCPPIDVVVAHSDDTLDLFRGEGYEVRQATPYERDTHSGTHVRQLMAEGGDWQRLVPPAVVEYLGRIDGAERVRRLTMDA